jgi:hypothetical protein
MKWKILDRWLATIMVAILIFAMISGRKKKGKYDLQTCFQGLVWPTNN